MNVNIDVAISYAREMLNHLENLKSSGAVKVRSVSNTYFCKSNTFLSLGSEGYVDAQCAGLDENDEEIEV